MKKRLVIGNWKMNPIFVSDAPSGVEDMVSLADEIDDAIEEIEGNQLKVVICPPTIGLQQVVSEADLTNLAVGAQNAWMGDEGAMTGEVSMRMLEELGINYVILGHSERRKNQNETDEIVAKKVKSALEHDLIPILCVGEQEKDKSEVAIHQLKKALQDLSTEQIERTVIAYEPVWAIGTGDNASTDYVADVVASLRRTVDELGGNGKQVLMLYGGSVNAQNASEYASNTQINGALVGGASLNADEFARIVAIFAK